MWLYSIIRTTIHILLVIGVQIRESIIHTHTLVLYLKVGQMYDSHTASV